MREPLHYLVLKLEKMIYDDKSMCYFNRMMGAEIFRRWIDRSDQQ